MSETALHRYLPVITGFLLLIATALAGYYDQLYWFLLPAGLVLLFLSFHFTLFLFYVLLASIPWSIEYNFTPSLGTDLPDEPLMLLLAFVSLAALIYYRKNIDLIKKLAGKIY